MINENTKQFQMENGKVVGIDLDVIEVPDSKYKVSELSLIDENEAKGKVIAYCDSPSQLYLCFPYRKGQTTFANEIPVGKEVVISNGYNPPDYGWLAIKTEEGDIVGGLGLPYNRHVSFNIKFERQHIVTPPQPSDLESRIKKIEDWIHGFSV